MRLTWIDQARGLAVILVILFHANTLLRFGYEPIHVLTGLYSVFLPFRMPLLVFLSGFIAYFSLGKSAKVFFWGKLSAIVWPYLVWTVVHYFGAGADHSAWSVSLYLSYLWFLGYLFCYYTLSWALKNVPRTPLVLTAFLVAAVIPADSPTFRRFFFLWGIFLLGEVAHRNLDNFTTLLRSRAILILFIPVVISSVAATTSALDGAHIHYDPMYLAGVLSGILLACAGFVRLGDSMPDVIARTSAYVGRNSVVFYVVHFQVVYIVIVLCDGWQVRSPWVVTVLAALLAIAVSQFLCVLRVRSAIVAALFELPSPRDGRARWRSRLPWGFSPSKTHGPVTRQAGPGASG